MFSKKSKSTDNKYDNKYGNKYGNKNKRKYSNISLTKSLEDNISLLENIFSGDEMLITRRFQNKHLSEAKCCILYFEGMVNNEVLNENIIMPVLSNNLAEEINSKNLLEELQYKVIASNDVKISDDLDKINYSVTSGDTIFLLEGYDKAMIINTKGWKSRSISEPESARVVRGPREGFTESININLSLIRRKINNPDLKFKFNELGERTRTKICVCYIEGLALESIINELERRLDKMEIDAILDSGYIQEYIRDEPFSPFETIGASERPDVIAAKLLEGFRILTTDRSICCICIGCLYIY